MNKLIAFIAIAALGVGVFVLLQPSPIPPQGGSSGQDHTNPEFFHDGAYLASYKDKDGSLLSNLSGSGETTSLVTLTAAQVCEQSYIPISMGTATGTITLPSQPLLTSACLSYPGDVRELYIRNATSTGGSTIVIAAGASSSLYTSAQTTSTTVINYATSTLAPGSIAKLKGIRITSSTPWIIWMLEVMR